PGAERDLQQAFDRQLANTSLAAAAEFLTVFTVQYITRQGEFSDSEREHYPQLVEALGSWAMQAPLGDRARAQAAIAALSAAAREAALDSDEAFARAGMDDSLRHMSRMAVTLREALQAYGLDLAADLRAMDVQLQSQTGDVAMVRMQYRLAGSPIDTVVQLQRLDGRWYVSDFLRHARDALQRPAPEPAPGPPTDADSEAPAACVPLPARADEARRRGRDPVCTQAPPATCGGGNDRPARRCRANHPDARRVARAGPARRAAPRGEGSEHAPPPQAGESTGSRRKGPGHAPSPAC